MSTNLALSFVWQILMFSLLYSAISMASPMSRPSTGGDGSSTSRQPVAQSSRSTDSSSCSSSSDKEKGDVRTLVWDLDVARQALGEESREAERLRLCLSAVEVALAVAERETAAVEATVAEA